MVMCERCGGTGEVTLVTLDQQVRDGHAEYNRLIANGTQPDDMPRHVRDLERHYQRIKKSEARARLRRRST